MSRPETDPPSAEQAKAIVLDFLERCRSWGTDLEIPKLLTRLAADPSPKDAAKLHQWTTWVAFVDHATEELRNGELDDWFRDARAAGYRTVGADEPD